MLKTEAFFFPKDSDVTGQVVYDFAEMVGGNYEQHDSGSESEVEEEEPKPKKSKPKEPKTKETKVPKQIEKPTKMITLSKKKTTIK